MNLCESFSTGLLCLLSLGLVNGCRQDMQNQPKMPPLRGSAFFRDGRSARTQVAGTVARSEGNSEDYFHTGMNGKIEGDGIPLPVTIELLELGRERFNIFCAPCHSRVGNGKGIIVQRGFHAAANLHSGRLRQAPLGHFFWVITNGYGAMPNYASQLTPTDRWAVTAYIRALQLSQDASASTDLPSRVHPADLIDISVRNGFSKDFLKDWMPQQWGAAVQLPQAAVPVPSKTAGSAETAMPTSAGQLRVSKSAIAENPARKPDPAKGEVLYMANCSMCHQKTRAGLPPMIPSLIDVVGRVGGERVRLVARNGLPEAKPPMPAHPDFSEQDLDDLVAFLKAK